MGVGGQRHAPVALPPGKKPGLSFRITAKVQRMGIVDTLHVVNYANDVHETWRLFFNMKCQNKQTL